MADWFTKIPDKSLVRFNLERHEWEQLIRVNGFREPDLPAILSGPACPSCNGPMKRDSTDTANTKKNSLGWHRKRSFLCLRSDCQKPLKTIEQVFIDPLSVTDVEKRRGEVEPFDYDKLCSGLQKASTRLHRTKDIKDMALQVAEDLRHQEFPHDRTPGRPARYQTSSKTIGDTVLRVLANHSQSTWFVRFCMQFHRLDRQTLQLPALLDTVGHDFAASLTNNTMHPA